MTLDSLERIGPRSVVVKISRFERLEPRHRLRRSGTSNSAQAQAFEKCGCFSGECVEVHLLRAGWHRKKKSGPGNFSGGRMAISAGYPATRSIQRNIRLADHIPKPLRLTRHKLIELRPRRRERLIPEALELLQHIGFRQPLLDVALDLLRH